MITDKVGANAIGVFESSRVQVISGESGSVKEALEKFKAGRLSGDPAFDSVDTSSGAGREKRRK